MVSFFYLEQALPLGLLVHPVDVGLEVDLHHLALELERCRDEASLGRPRLGREGHRDGQLECLQAYNARAIITDCREQGGTGE